jgi:hypothetical protein
MRCNVPQFLEIYDAQQNLSVINCLKNYPRNSISQSQVKESILSKMRIHISLTNDDDIENGIITHVNDKCTGTQTVYTRTSTRIENEIFI